MRGGVGGVEKEARQLENKEQTKNSAGTADWHTLKQFPGLASLPPEYWILNTEYRIQKPETRI